MPYNIPNYLTKVINKEYWGKEFNPAIDNNVENVTTYIIYAQTGYVIYNNYNYNLFKVIIIDFKGQTEERFKLYNIDTKRRFRDFLRQNGVYIKIEGQKIVGPLAHVVNLKEMPKQPLEEIKKQKRKGVMNS